MGLFKVWLELGRKGWRKGKKERRRKRNRDREGQRQSDLAFTWPLTVLQTTEKMLVQPCSL